MKVLRIGRRAGFAPASWCWRSFWCGCRPRQAEHQQRRCQSGETRIVQYQAAGGGGDREPEQRDGRTQQIEHGSRKGGPAEYGMHEQEDHELARRAGPAIKTALASEGELRILDDLVAQIERLAERKKA